MWRTSSSGPGRGPSATRTCSTDERRTGPRIMGGGRARERSCRPTGSGARGGAARALDRSTRSARAPNGPLRSRDMGEAERESAHAGRRCLGASEGRRARSARALDGPPDMGRPSARALELADGVWGHRKGAGRAAPEHWRGPRYGEAERESARAGRRGLGASEGRRARSARALDGPPDVIV